MLISCLVINLEFFLYFDTMKNQFCILCYLYSDKKNILILCVNLYSSSKYIKKNYYLK